MVRLHPGPPMPEDMTERPLTRDELERLADSIKRTEVTSENLPILRMQVAVLREPAGKERTALEAIRWVRNGAERIGAHEDVVDLIWEDSLVGKHYIMRARDEKGLNAFARALFPVYGFYLMRRSAKEAAAYIEAHNVEAKRPRSHRFLGEIEMLSKRPDKAVEHFQIAVNLFQQMEDPPQRVNALELSGFLAEALILSGHKLEGISLAKRTFEDYNYGYPLVLKERDYYTWAVWKSGCAIKAWHALLRGGVSLEGIDRERLVEMLKESEKVVNPSPEIKVWGDFTLRRNEIAAIKRSLKLD